MKIFKRISTWLGFGKRAEALRRQTETMKEQAEAIKQQAEVTAKLLDAVQNLKEEKNTTQPIPVVQEPQPGTTPTVVSESGITNEELQQQLQTLTTLNKEQQQHIEKLEKQLTTAREDGVRTLFADFKKNQEEDKEKQEKAGRPRIDGKNTNIRIDIDTYNMLVFLAERKVIKRTRYINDKLRDGLMEDIQADPVFGSLYKEFKKPEKIRDEEEDVNNEQTQIS